MRVNGQAAMETAHKRQYAVKCLIPTKSFQVDAMITMYVHDHMVTVLQYEVTSEKLTATKDVKKLSIMLCWNMCYTGSMNVEMKWGGGGGFPHRL